ncbi:DUF6158 family protein [Micromonospora globbae]|jgi:hypothetical protein|uniref:DUF6158 family protein n=1 Tax=Micromonospora globbae TaxID=1894969 RepID=A0A420EWZ2_9ACTN|nr:DUF6158 family protein [Micromonospora globbae]RKF25210.1 hypothetical protein D7I43_22375 [Micromonospora globbae]WTF85215.1 DUF6158 family protein [Micromonospora globbae]
MMTGSVRQGGYPTSGDAGASPEQRVTEWSGDHLADPATAGPDPDGELGVDPAELTDEDLIREMHSLHRTRLDTLRHAADSALAHHLRRTAELETEYLARHPGREVDPSRLRDE